MMASDEHKLWLCSDIFGSVYCFSIEKFGGFKKMP